MLIVTLVWSSCSSMQPSTENAITAGLLGCLVGGGIGQLAGKNTSSTVAGCVAGGAVGATTGYWLGLKQEHQARKEDMLAQILADLQYVQGRVDLMRRNLESQLAQDRASLAKLQAKLHGHEKLTADETNLLDRAKRRRAEAHETLERAKLAADNLDYAVGQYASDNGASKAADASREVEDLKRNVARIAEAASAYDVVGVG